MFPFPGSTARPAAGAITRPRPAAAGTLRRRAKAARPTSPLTQSTDRGSRTAAGPTRAETRAPRRGSVSASPPKRRLPKTRRPSIRRVGRRDAARWSRLDLCLDRGILDASAQVSGAPWIYPGRDGIVGGRRYVAATAPPHRLLPPSDPPARRLHGRSYRAVVAGRPLASVAAVALVTVFASAGAAAGGPPAPTTAFPAAGELTQAVAVRSAPASSAPIVRRMPRFRPDHQFQIVLALASRRGRDGELWYRLSLPGRPNGARGWVRADAVEVRPVVNRIVVRLGARTLEVRRVRDGKLLLASTVAVGAAGHGDPARPRLLRPVRVRADGSVLRDVRAGDDRLCPRQRLADERRRHPRHEPARALGPGGFAWLRPRRQRRRSARLRRLAPLGTPIDIVR